MRKSMLIVTGIHREDKYIKTYLAILSLIRNHTFDITTIMESNNHEAHFTSILAPYNKDNLDIYLCGFDTDLHVVLYSKYLIKLGYTVRVLTNYCNSRGGKASHNLAIHNLKTILGNNALIKQNCLF